MAKRTLGTSPAHLAAELSLGYEVLHKAALALGIRTTKVEGKGWRIYAPEDAERLRRHFAGLADRAARAVPLAEAAKALGVSYPVARRLFDLGELVADGDPAERWVTRASLEAVITGRADGAPYPVGSPAGFVPIEDVMARLGIGRMDAMALSGKGVVLRRTADYRFHAEVASLEAYLVGRARTADQAGLL